MKRDLKKPMSDKKIEPTEPLISIKNLEVKFINQDGDSISNNTFQNDVYAVSYTHLTLPTKRIV